MRNLTTTDLFKAIRLVKTANLKNEIKAFAEIGKEKTEDAESIGFDFVLTLIEKIGEVKLEEALYDFLSGPLEKSVVEIADADVLELITEIVNDFDVNSWKTFFGRVSDLTMKEK